MTRELAVPTAAAGLNDWSDTAGPETRVGLVHAAVGRWGALQGRRGRRTGPAVPDKRNGVCPGQHLHSHGRPAAGGHNQRRLRHLPHGPAAPSGSPTAASCAARPAHQSPATRRASRTGVSRSAPSHRRCGPQPSARVVTEDTVLRASNGPDRRGCSITETIRPVLCACHGDGERPPAALKVWRHPRDYIGMMSSLHSSLSQAGRRPPEVRHGR